MYSLRVTAVCVDLAKYKPKSCDVNIIMWVFFSHLACKEVYHIIIFICTACCLCFAMVGKCTIVSYPGSPHILSLQCETSFVYMQVRQYRNENFA